MWPFFGRCLYRHPQLVVKKPSRVTTFFSLFYSGVCWIKISTCWRLHLRRALRLQPSGVDWDGTRSLRKKSRFCRPGSNLRYKMHYSREKVHSSIHSYGTWIWNRSRRVVMRGNHFENFLDFCKHISATRWPAMRWTYIAILILELLLKWLQIFSVFILIVF